MTFYRLFRQSLLSFDGNSAGTDVSLKCDELLQFSQSSVKFWPGIFSEFILLRTIKF